MTLSVGFRITVSLLILLPKLRGSDYYPGGTNSHRTRQPSLDAHRQLSSIPLVSLDWRWRLSIVPPRFRHSPSRSQAMLLHRESN